MNERGDLGLDMRELKLLKDSLVGRLASGNCGRTAPGAWLGETWGRGERNAELGNRSYLQVHPSLSPPPIPWTRIWRLPGEHSAELTSFRSGGSPTPSSLRTPLPGLLSTTCCPCFPSRLWLSVLFSLREQCDALEGGEVPLDCGSYRFSSALDQYAQLLILREMTEQVSFHHMANLSSLPK